MVSTSQTRATCAQKQLALAVLVAQHAQEYGQLFSEDDVQLLSLSLAEIAEQCSSGQIAPESVLKAYGKKALAAHAATNCLADVMFDVALSSYKPDRPLSGVPISLKDVVDIAGHDSTIGFVSRANKPAATSAPIVRLLQDAGALLHVKTTLPTALMSFETESDLFGRTSNPYNPDFSPGGSTGGGGALLAYGGSKIEIATDLGGSIRLPAAYCGVYGMKASSGRFPTQGCQTSAPGLEGMQTASPMARNLDDLQTFWQRVIEMKPWEYDHTCAPIPWRPVDFVLADRKPKWAVIWDDGLVSPTPACKRALRTTVEALRAYGCEVVDYAGPDPLEGLKIGLPISFGDGGVFVKNTLSPGETVSPTIGALLGAVKLPLFVKRGIASFLRWWSTPTGRNDDYADMLERFHPLTIAQEREAVVLREEYRARWAAALREQGTDFVLTVPHALPPMPKGQSGTATLVSANYVFLYNILDVPAAVMPMAFVDKALDALSANFTQSETYQRFNDVERAVYSLYDPEAMHGLPLGVQIAGQRFEEEKVLEGMQVVERALKAAGKPFIPREF